jgi:hypothetical protein
LIFYFSSSQIKSNETYFWLENNFHIAFVLFVYFLPVHPAFAVLSAHVWEGSDEERNERKKSLLRYKDCAINYSDSLSIAIASVVLPFSATQTFLLSLYAHNVNYLLEKFLPSLAAVTEDNFYSLSLFF